MSINKYSTNLAFPIIAINVLSLLAQIVQIGTITPTLSIFLDYAGSTELQIGWVVAASWIAILLIYKFVPYIIHRLGTINAILVSSAISLLSIMGMMFSNDILILFFLNFLLGCGLILRWVVCDTWLILLTNENNCGRVIGIHETLMGLGIAIGPLLIMVVEHSTLRVFYVCFALLLLSALLVVFLKKYECHPDIPVNHYDKKITPTIFVALFAAFATGMIETSMISFLPLMYIHLGIALSISTMLLSSFGFGGALLQMPIGWIADKTTTRFTLGLLCIIAILTILLLPYLGRYFFAHAALFICGGCIGGLNTLAVLDANSKVQKTQLSTSMMLIAVAYTLGSITGPVMTGILAQYHHYGLLWISLIFLIICFVLVMVSSITARQSGM